MGCFIGKKVVYSEASKEEKEILKYEKRVFWLKVCEYITLALFFVSIFVSLTVVIVFQIHNNLSDYKEAATVVSTYTSIILGFVAMAVSLIGMVLSFHNTRQAEDSNLSSTREFTKLTSLLERLNELEAGLDANLKDVSNKINDLDKQMNAFKQLDMQLMTVQKNIEQISTDFRNSLDKSKGSDTIGTNQITPALKDLTGNLESDDNQKLFSGYQPNGNTPVAPSTDQASQPNGNTPAAPSTDQASQPNGGTPVAPSTDQASQLNGNTPVAPSTDQVSQPNGGTPVAPSTDQASQPDVNESTSSNE